ncbi:MFS transporter [Methanofollis fontis]|uniref:MFS transporter n=1 Tax=Methanofollis fontis TaxID=2052832 RepID=A0A483CVC1_9EURY|nr:MFS transporter [Methanofollis fontis]TAJ43338.1 MFS transporter [Methanofollis fontis]
MPDPAPSTPLDRRAAYLIILLFGIVSLFGDVIYEGARSVTGPYLFALGGSALVVGVVAGLGEFLGYALRLLSGHLADATHRYWTLTFLGYGMLIAVPLLALAGSWEMAALLFIVERMGKGIRAPAKDAILSNVTSSVGRGWGFGIHEALDQIGAIIGPIIFSAAFLLHGNYRAGFALLLIPFALMMLSLVVTRSRAPAPAALERAGGPAQQAPPTSTLVPYAIFTALTMAGFVAFPLIAYHLTATATLSEAEIPLYYAVAMGVDAAVALIAGRLYDRIGLSVLAAAPIIGIAVPFLAFTSSPSMALAAAALWGAAMGIQETVLRAAVADYTHLSKRGRAYGIFNTIYGAGWFAGSAVIGWVYGISIPLAIGFAAGMQMLALPVFFHAKRRMETGRASGT